MYMAVWLGQYKSSMFWPCMYREFEMNHVLIIRDVQLCRYLVKSGRGRSLPVIITYLLVSVASVKRRTKIDKVFLDWIRNVATINVCSLTSHFVFWASILTAK